MFQGRNQSISKYMKNCNGAGKQDTLHLIQCDFFIYNFDSVPAFVCSIEDAGRS